MSEAELVKTRIARSRRLTAGFTQILSFLALVEEGDLDRVAARRGLGRSTVRGHLGQMAADFGDGLFRGIARDLLPTEAAFRAYRMLRPLMAEITDAVSELSRIEPPRLNRFLVLIPDGLPGCGLAGASAAGSQAVEAMRGCSDILPAAHGSIDPSGDLVLAFAAGTSGALRDRWAVIGLPGEPGWLDGSMMLSELRGLGLDLPAVTEALQERMERLAAAVGAKPRRTVWSPSGLLSQAGDRSARASLVLLPASLINQPMLGRHFRCALLERSTDDPELTILTGRDSRLDPAEIKAFIVALTEALARDTRRQAAVAMLPDQARLTLRHCLSFCALHEERNMRRASERLCIVQPALTVQLHRIEEQLGETLFERSSLGVRPNHRADLLYALLHPPLSQLLHSVQSLAGVEAGSVLAKLRMGTMPSLDEDSTIASGLARALDDWSRALPGQDVEVTEAFSAKLVRWLREGRVDLILVDQDFSDPDLVFETVATDSLAVIIDGGSDLLPAGPVCLEKLGTLPLVLPSRRHGLRDLLLQTFSARGWQLHPRIEIDSMAAALSLVRTKRYATILPVGAVHSSRARRRISVHEIHSPRLLRRICVGRRRDAKSQAARSLVDAIRAAFAEDSLPDEAGGPTRIRRQENHVQMAI